MSGEGGEEGVEVGVGVVVEGEVAVRGMELMTRSEARGRVFTIFGCGGGLEVSEDGEGWEVGGCGWEADLPSSSQAARAAGSTGQVEEEALFGGGELLVEGVLPIVKLIK